MKVSFSTLKRNAKDVLRGNWGNAIGILVVYGLISYAVSMIAMVFYPFREVIELAQSPSANAADLMAIYPKFGTMWLVSTLISIFFAAPLSCGYVKVWLDRSRGLHTTIGTLFWVFSSRYTAFLKTYVWMLLFMVLWTMLFGAVIGICAAITVTVPVLGILLMIAACLGLLLIFLRYELLLYLFIDHPQMYYRDILNESKRLMAGNLWRYIGFSLSFLGWLLLCILIIPALWVTPYIGVSMANFYRSLIGDLPQQQPAQPAKPELEY